MNYEIGQTVYINNPKTTWHRKPGQVVGWNTSNGYYEVEIAGVEFSYWFPPEELTAERPSLVAHPQIEFGIGRIGDVDPAEELLAELEAAEIMAEQARKGGAPKRKSTLCDCGHWTYWPMSASLGTSCPECYDRMSD